MLGQKHLKILAVSVSAAGYGLKSKFGTCLDAVKINTDENNSK